VIAPYVSFAVFAQGNQVLRVTDKERQSLKVEDSVPMFVSFVDIPFVVTWDFIFFAKGSEPKHVRDQIALHAVHEFLAKHFPGKDTMDIAEMVQHLMSQFDFGEKIMPLWDQAFHPSHYYNADEVSVPKHDLSSDTFYSGVTLVPEPNQSNESNNSESSDSGHKQEYQVSSAKIEDDISFRDLEIELNSTPKRANSQPITVDGMKNLIIGEQGEHIVYHYLKGVYKDMFSPFNWKSSIRKKVFPSCASGVDDSCGYDFEVEDAIGFFKKHYGPTKERARKLYIEVKSCAGCWDGQFIVSSNEMEKRRQVITSNGGTYLVMIVENVMNRENVAITVLDHNVDFALVPMSFKANVSGVKTQQNSKQSTIAGPKSEQVTTSSALPINVPSPSPLPIVPSLPIVHPQKSSTLEPVSLTTAPPRPRHVSASEVKENLKEEVEQDERFYGTITMIPSFPNKFGKIECVDGRWISVFFREIPKQARVGDFVSFEVSEQFKNPQAYKIRMEKR
jgi:hypothetical protein